MTPAFSVILPTYNRGYLLEDALDSIFEQGIPGVQTIVIDDGSTDDTALRVAAYGDRIEYIRFEENRGSAAVRNAGLRRAVGEYITFLDSDDVWVPGKLQTEMALFAAWPEVGMVVSDSEHWLEGKLLVPSRFDVVRLRRPDCQWTHSPYVLPQSPPLWFDRSLVSTCCMTVKRSVLETQGVDPFDESLGANEDWDLEIRLYHQCPTLVNPVVLARVRRFADATRRLRALPGAEPTPQQQRAALLRRRRIVEKGILRPGLFPGEQERGLVVLEAIDAMLAEIAAAVPA